jgi:L-asparaginase II
MRAMNGTVVKTGAEAVYVAMLPDQKLGIALKITDGATRASQVAITALLIRLGALDRDHPEAMKHALVPIANCRRITTGHMRPAPGLID